MYFRFTYNGIGIYEAFKQNVPINVWRNFLSSESAKWLPKPEVYDDKEAIISLFTKVGRDMFVKKTLPIMLQYLDKNKIKEESINYNGNNPLYNDKYQIVIYATALEPIHEATSARKYKCPYCEYRAIRSDLVKHIDKKHKDLIPAGYSATRVVYEAINHKDHGICRICKQPTTWNEKTGRFNILCDNPKCKEAMRKQYEANMTKVYGTSNLLTDPEHQKEMLANRKISGKYKFQDGGVVEYTGSYEKKMLEFMDVVMEIRSQDLMSPGPTMEYMYNNEKHYYIPDFFYIPYNLIIEIKDGGNNPNNKVSPSMIASREKTLAKEKMITDKGEYNYVRVSNNDFAQLIEIMMDLKKASLDNLDEKIVRVNE